MDDPAIDKSDLNDSGDPSQTPAEVPARDQTQVPVQDQAQVQAQDQALMSAQVAAEGQARAPAGDQAQVAAEGQARAPAPRAGRLPVIVACTRPRAAPAAAGAAAHDDPPPAYDQCARARRHLQAFAIVLQEPKLSMIREWRCSGAGGGAGGGGRVVALPVAHLQRKGLALCAQLKGKGQAAAVPPSPSPDLEGQRAARRAWPQVLATLLAGLLCLALGYVDAWSAFALNYFKGSSRAGARPCAFAGNASLAASVALGQLVVAPPAAHVASLVAVGGLLGSLPAGAVAEAVGRRATILLMTLPTIVSWALVLISNNTQSGLYLSRILVGFAMGVTSIVVPMYTEEIAEVRWRGALVAGAAGLFPAGLALGTALGLALPFPLTALLPCFAPLALLVLLPAAPESPAFLARRGLLRDARLAVRFLRGRWVDVEQQLTALRARVSAGPDAQAAPAPLPLRLRLLGACRRWLCLGRHRGTRITLLLMLHRQLTGAHAVAFFAMEMLSSAEGTLWGQQYIILIGALQIAATLFASLTVDKVGRRPLLFLSAVGMSLSHMGLAYFTKFTVGGHDMSHIWWAPLVMIAGYVVMYSVGFGPLPWLMMTELIPAKDKRWATSLAGIMNWGGMIIILQIFSFFNGAASFQIAFLFFSVTCFTASIFISLCVPETTGKTPEEIQDILHWNVVSHFKLSLLGESEDNSKREKLSSYSTCKYISPPYHPNMLQKTRPHG